MKNRTVLWRTVRARWIKKIIIKPEKKPVSEIVRASYAQHERREWSVVVFPMFVCSPLRTYGGTGRREKGQDRRFYWPSRYITAWPCTWDVVVVLSLSRPCTCCVSRCFFNDRPPPRDADNGLLCKITTHYAARFAQRRARTRQPSYYCGHDPTSPSLPPRNNVVFPPRSWAPSARKNKSTRRPSRSGVCTSTTMCTTTVCTRNGNVYANTKSTSRGYIQVGRQAYTTIVKRTPTICATAGPGL